MITRRTFTSLGLGTGLMLAMGLSGCKGGKGSASDPLAGSRIRAVRLTSGGGMTGGGDSTELRRGDDGRVTLSTRSREWHNSRETGMDYVVDESAFDQLAQIANDYDLRAASTRKDSDLLVLDAPTSHLVFDLMAEDGGWDPDASFTISSEQELTDRDREGWRAVTTALAELAAGSEGVPYLEPIRLTITAQGYQFPFYLNDSSAANDLSGRCPLNVTIEDYADNEKIFYLDEPLDVSDTPLATGEAGTLCYFEPWGDVVVFYADGEPYDGLYELGCVEYEHDAEYLADMLPGAGYVWSSATEE